MGTSFELPANFSDAALTINSFAVDDRGVLFLNGVAVASAGIFAPGPGSMTFEPGGADPCTFSSSASGPFTPITTGFLAGTNTLAIIVNDTNSGIAGGLSGGVNCGFPNCLAPTSVDFSADITFTTSPVPLPASLPLPCVGIAGVVANSRRWRRA